MAVFAALYAAFSVFEKGAADSSGSPAENFSEFDLLFNVGAQLADGHADLLHGIPIPHGDAAVALFLSVAHGVKVHRDAQGGADPLGLLVLPS